MDHFKRPSTMPLTSQLLCYVKFDWTMFLVGHFDSIVIENVEGLSVLNTNNIKLCHDY